ncbi:MAG: helix-turn-helix transcriptional regulator [Pseudonocardiaceae bacterium]
MGLAEFASLINDRRALRRMSQEALAVEAGVSKSTVYRLGKAGYPAPGRTTAMDLAHAVGVDLDGALALLGHEPLSDAERAVLSPPADPWPELESLRASLSEAQLWALVHTARAMVDRYAPVPADQVPSEVAGPAEGPPVQHWRGTGGAGEIPARAERPRAET